jgi:hypothetical protein
MQLVVGRGVGVLRRDLRAELEVLAHGGAERLVVGHAGGIEGGEVELDEARALGLGDLQAAVHVDQVLEAELPAEPIGSAERLRP